jgi:transcriptional regulator with XRE-family HTH domain
MINLLEIGIQLAQKRNALKLSQFQLAEICGVSDLTIRRIEKGHKGTSI